MELSKWRTEMNAFRSNLKTDQKWKKILPKLNAARLSWTSWIARGKYSCLQNVHSSWATDFSVAQTTNQKPLRWLFVNNEASW